MISEKKGNVYHGPKLPYIPDGQDLKKVLLFKRIISLIGRIRRH